MSKQLGLAKVNVTFKLGDLSEKAQKWLLDCGYMMTNSRFDTALICGGTTKKLWNKDTELGLQIYRDYFLCVDLYYPAYNHNTYWDEQENPEVGYLPLEIGRFNKSDKSITPIDRTYNYTDTAKWLEDNKVDIDDIFEEFTKILRDGGDTRVLEDLDADAIEEALECGDLDLLEELVGDRDLMEIM
jgi:hypothetical protein